MSNAFGRYDELPGLVTSLVRGYLPEAGFFETLSAGARHPFVAPPLAPAVQDWGARRDQHSLTMRSEASKSKQTW